ncbi:hypothetical protein [Streptomyces bambusae]|uniref:Uncharacterized protein n=1 Tax=Streptomyces bambusae TaxID=1550616 RepID=A0ABS6Z267_9ACTN|nr:hypothetical protein [Streptomyces bambusae]MBW5481832.1 hypothetical protein [Streptomyces bambusae]
MGDDSWFSLAVRYARTSPLRRLARLLLWGCAGWVLSDAYVELTAGGPLTLTLLVLFGAAIGGVGSVACGIGGGAALLLQGVPPAALLWWFLPLVLVFGIVQLTLAEAVSSRRTGEVVLLVTGYGLDEPGRRLPRLVEWLAHGALAVPLVLWARQPALSSLVILGLAGVMHQQFLKAVRSLSRYRRMEVQVSALSWITCAALLALSPVGAVIAERSPERLFVVLVYLLVAGALSGALTVCIRFCERAFISVVGSPQVRHRTVFSAAYGFLLLPAWLGALTLTARPGTATAETAQTLGLAVALHLLFLALFMKRPCVWLHRLDASLFVRYTNQGDEEWLQKTWRYDATHGRKGKPDLTLVKVLDESAARISQGTFIPPAPEHWNSFMNGKRSVELSVHWTDKAVRLLNLTAPAKDAAREVRLEHRACRIGCLTTLGYAYLLHGYPEDGQRALLDAAELCRRAGLANIRVQIAKDAWLAGLDIGLRDLRPLEDALMSPHVVPALRARMMIEVGSLLYAWKDPRLDAFLDRMSRIPFHPESAGAEKIQQVRHTVTITAAGIGGRFLSSPDDLDVFVRGAEVFREQVPGNVRMRAFVSGVLGGMLDVPGSRAIRWGVVQLGSGVPERGAEILYRTALRLVRRGLGAVAAELLELSGEAYARTDPRRALACLQQAVALRDDGRTNVLGGEQRIAYSATTEPLYQEVVGLLVEEAADPVKAFDLVERARSRDLVDLLGERVPRPELDGLTDVVAAMLRVERAAEEVERSGSRIGRAYVVPRRYGATPSRDEDGWSPGLRWAEAMDAATAAQRELFETMKDLEGAGLDEEALDLVWLLGREAVAERSLHVEARRMRVAVDRAGPLRARRRARDRQLAVWDALADHGGRAAEYVALRRGTPITFAQVRTLLAEAGSAGQGAKGAAPGEEVGGAGPDDRDDHGVSSEVQDQHVGDDRAG